MEERHIGDPEATDCEEHWSPWPGDLWPLRRMLVSWHSPGMQRGLVLADRISLPTC